MYYMEVAKELHKAHLQNRYDSSIHFENIKNLILN